MSKTQSYQVKKGEENHYHLECIKRRHDEKNKEYIDDKHIIILSQQEFKLWDKLKEVNGFSSIKILHNPKDQKKELDVTFPVVYLGEEVKMTRVEMKKTLKEHKITFFNGAAEEDLIELLGDIKSEE
ncbi:MAG: hypothetical protein U9O94_07970 [Nanoarchaeota archaeon]|nr:hypothetical protein [Nanoarchaeota archaeon]